MSISPFLNRVAKRDKGHAGRKAETETSKRMKGTLQPGSGAIAGAKGDLKKDTPTFSFLLENKTTQSASYVLKQDVLHKIYQEALESNRTPALAVQFVRPNGSSERRDRWVMIPEATYLEMIGD